MSSVTTTQINTIDGTTPLTLRTGNTPGPAIVLNTVDTITLKSNSTVDAASFNTTTITTNLPITVNNNVTAGALVIGTNDVSREIQISGSGAVVGYDGTDAFLEGGSGKGVSLYVNATAKALDIDTTQTATFSNNLIVTRNVTAANLTATSMLLGNSSISPNGYITLPGGLKLQWGSASISTTVSTVTFPIAFDAVIYSLNITPQSSASPWIVSANTTAFRADTDNSTTVYYMAIGV